MSPGSHLLRRRSWLIVAAVLLHGCNAGRAAKEDAAVTPVVEAPPLPDWQRAAAPADIERIGGLDAAWSEALADAGRGRTGRSVVAEGKLLEPDAGLSRPAPAPGSYMCRLIQLGSTARRSPAFAASKPVFCYVGVDDRDRLWLAKQTGALRRQGYLLEDVNPRRMIFLGGLAEGSKDAPLAYGEDPERDTAGILQRIGPLRYRLVTPWPKGNYKLEVLELTPAPVQRDD